MPVNLDISIDDSGPGRRIYFVVRETGEIVSNVSIREMQNSVERGDEASFINPHGQRFVHPHGVMRQSVSIGAMSSDIRFNLVPSSRGAAPDPVDRAVEQSGRPNLNEDFIRHEAGEDRTMRVIGRAAPPARTRPDRSLDALLRRVTEEGTSREADPLPAADFLTESHMSDIVSEMNSSMMNGFQEYVSQTLREPGLSRSILPAQQVPPAPVSRAKKVETGPVEITQEAVDEFVPDLQNEAAEPLIDEGIEHFSIKDLLPSESGDTAPPTQAMLLDAEDLVSDILMTPPEKRSEFIQEALARTFVTDRDFHVVLWRALREAFFLETKRVRGIYGTGRSVSNTRKAVFDGISMPEESPFLTGRSFFNGQELKFNLMPFLDSRTGEIQPQTADTVPFKQ